MTDLSPNGFLARLFSRRRAGAAPAATLLAVALCFAAVASAQERQDTPDADAGQAAPKNPSKSAQNARPAAPRETVKSALKGKEEIEGADFVRRRADWFFRPRAFPIGFIPHGARERALQEMRQMYQREGRLGFLAPTGVTGFVAPPSGTASAWTSIGPQPTGSSSNPPFTSGRVTALAVNPNNSNNVYLGGADGGLWVTTDGGATWNPLTDNPVNSGIPTVAVGAVAVDPTTCAAGGICTTVYVGTGEDNFAGDNIYGEGVLRCVVTAGTPPTALCTQDTTFHQVSPLDDTHGGPMIGALAVNRAAGRNNILLAGVRGRGSALVSGVWCSSDMGSTWTRVLPTTLTNGVGDPGTDVAFASDGTAWAALGFFTTTTGNGIYKSSAPVTSCSGIIWKAQTLPVTASSIGRITLALAPSSNATIYAAIADASTASSTLLAVVRSTNANMATTPTWTQLSDPLVSAALGFCTGQCFYDMALSVDPRNPAVVYAGGSSQNPIIRTTNGTTTASWADVTAAGGTVPHVDTHAFAFAGDGSKLYVGNDGGMWSTNTPDATISWNNLNGPAASSVGALNLTQFYPGVSIHPSNPGFAMGGTQDNDIQLDQAATLPSAGLTWRDAGLGCDGGFTAIDLQIPSTSYGECEYVPSSLLAILVTFAGDGVLSNGFLATSGIDGTDRGSFIPPLIIDKSNSQRLYFGTFRLWQTVNGANTWSAITGDLTQGGVLSAIAVAPSDSSVVYTGADDGSIFVNTSVGAGTPAMSTRIDNATLPTRSVTDLAVDPASAATAYTTFSGFGTCSNSAVTCDGKGHVFKTVNGTAGAATIWTDISGTTTKLPDIPVNAIVIDPDDPARNTLYVGTDIGAFFTTDGGVIWSPLGAADTMPNSQVLSLGLHGPSRTLRAATHGRGMWDLNLGGQAAFGITSIAPFTANAGSSSITPFTVNGNGFTTSSKIQFGGGVTLTPTFVSATQLTATIPAANLAAGAAVPVSVTDPGQVNPTNSVPFTVLNPIPGITSISPATTTAGTTGFSLTVNGSNFICGGSNATIVLFNLSPRTNIVPGSCSSTQLKVALPDSDLAVGQVAIIDTFTPQPGGGFDTNPTPPQLTINNPVPTLTSISPTSAAAGSAAFTLTVTGSNFNPSSAVNFNGIARATTVVSAMQLTASILASDIATAGTKPVTVSNPAPGGGTTAPMSFTVTPDFTLTPQAPTSVTLTAGNPASYTVAVAPTNGFTGTVNLSCTLPATATATTCAVNPPTVTLGSGSNVTANVTTTKRGALPPMNLPARRKPLGRTAPIAFVAILALLLAALAARTRRQRLVFALPLAALIIVLVLQVTGCSGGGGGGGTPAGTYTVTITGTSGTSSTSTTVTLIVN